MYECIIGLEIHIKLNSKNKLFCKCKNEQEFDNLEPNTHICPVCTWQPWALPVLNEEPFQKAVLLWHILNCRVNNTSAFDRKSYFYPDLPMWYQITQLDRPTNQEGFVQFYTDNYETENKIRIQRAHIESDAGKTIHQWWWAIVDYNRSGTPLIEIVTYPDFFDSEQAVQFLKELQRLVRFNNIWYADLEKWQMRCDVNISVRQKWSDELWTKVEIKNMNSFSAIKRAINNEFERQVEILENWWNLDQETRGWNDDSLSSYTMRSKEDSLDYRYFPEPDLLPLQVSDEYIGQIKQDKIESTFDKIKKYKEKYWFNKEYINWLIQSKDINFFFEDIISKWADPKLAANWLVTEVLWFMNEDIPYIDDFKFSKNQFFQFIKMIQEGKLMQSHGKQVLKEMISTWKDPNDIVNEKWLIPMDSSELEKFVDEVIQENTTVVDDVKNWQQKAIWFLVWQVMKKSWWKADPKQVNSIIISKIQ